MKESVYGHGLSVRAKWKTIKGRTHTEATEGLGCRVGTYPWCTSSSILNNYGNTILKYKRRVGSAWSCTWAARARRQNPSLIFLCGEGDGIRWRHRFLSLYFRSIYWHENDEIIYTAVVGSEFCWRSSKNSFFYGFGPGWTLASEIVLQISWIWMFSRLFAKMWILFHLYVIPKCDFW